jgi:uroporphyrinogen decarboxylase
VRYLADDGYTQTLIDEEGVRKEVLSHVVPAMPRFLEFPVKTRGDFAEITRRYDPGSTERYPREADWQAFLTAARRRIYPLGLMFDGFFGRLRKWMGLENLLYTLHDDPAFWGEMCEFHTDFILRTIRRAIEEAPIDYVNIWEDMAYKNGPLMSPRHVRRYLLPGYRRIVDSLRGHGIDTIFVDSDGNIDLLIPIWLEAGINGVWPLEIAAGMNPVDLRRRYGKTLLLAGGIDKRELSRGRAEVHDEVMRKVAPLIQAGGYIPTVDHSVPPDVPFENYVYFRQLIGQLSAD